MRVLTGGRGSRPGMEEEDMQIRKRLAALLAAAVLLTTAGCGAPAVGPDSAATSAAPAVTADPVEGMIPATGQVGAINGLTYTLMLGELEPGDSAEGRHFTPSGRTLAVNMESAAVRAADGEIEPDVPVSDIVAGDVVTVFLTTSDKCAYVTLEVPAAEVLGSLDAAEQGTAAAEITADEQLQGQTYASSQDDENALRISDAAVTLNSAVIRKSGGCSDPERGASYGMNAALLATDAADVIIEGSQIESDGLSACGVFSYGAGTSVSITESAVTTAGERSSGLRTAGGGSVGAHGLTVTTTGAESPAISSGTGGTTAVNGGAYATEGFDSPAVQTATETTIAAADLQAAASGALTLEGRGSLSLTDCTVSGAMSRTEGTGAAETVHNILIYGPAGADAQEGKASFVMHGGSLSSRNGDMFFVSNTTCSIELDGVQIYNRDQLSWLFNVSGNSGSLGWGEAGANGAHADITLRGQNTIGDTRVDSISSASVRLCDGTYLRGGIRLEPNEAASAEARGVVEVVIDEGCTWSLTGNSEVTTLENNGVIEFNGHTITLADGTVLSA